MKIQYGKYGKLCERDYCMYKHDATEDDEESVDAENEDDFESETDNTFCNPSQAKENSEHEEVVELEQFVAVDLKVYASCMNLN